MAGSINNKVKENEKKDQTISIGRKEQYKLNIWKLKRFLIPK